MYLKESIGFNNVQIIGNIMSEVSKSFGHRMHWEMRRGYIGIV